MSFWKRLFRGKVTLTRDVPNRDYHAVEVGATKFLARLLGQGVSMEIHILVPSYNEKEYGGNEKIVEAHYSNITRLGHFERLTIQKDAEKRGCVTLKIDPKGFRITQEEADGLFDGFAKVSGGW